MSKKPTVLMILDGYGLNDRHDANAVYEANTPVMDKLMAEYPFVKGNASGLAVGLPEGQMGNSEVGHMNMGAGRIVYQELTRITKEIQDGDFFKNEALLTAMKNAKENDSAIHFMGLLSDGGVHSHITHLFGLLQMAKNEGLKKVYVHCFLDGRDTPPASGKGYIQQLQAKMDELGVGEIGATPQSADALLLTAYFVPNAPLPTAASPCLPAALITSDAPLPAASPLFPGAACALSPPTKAFASSIVPKLLNSAPENPVTCFWHSAQVANTPVFLPFLTA